MENKIYLDQFIESLGVWSFGIQDKNGAISKELDPEIFTEIVRNGIMAIREGVHFFIPNINKVGLESMPKGVYTFSSEFLTLSYVARNYSEDSEEWDYQAHMLVVRCLSETAFSIVLWVSNNLKFWQPLPLYTVFSLDKSSELEKVPLYGYWAYECYRKSFSMIRQLPFQKLTEEETEYINETYMMPVIFKLFFGFWNKHEELKTRELSLYAPISLPDEEGDMLLLDWVKYQEVL